MSDIDQLLAQLLAGQAKQAKARSAANGSFTALLDSQINIGLGVRSRASRSQTYLRDLLRDENGRDSGFPRHLEDEALRFDRPDRAMLLNEPDSERLSLAKKAVNFFKMSRSILICRFSSPRRFSSASTVAEPWVSC